MIFELNSFTIDVIFLFFCILFTVLGYKKGFVNRFYDLIGTIICLILSLYTYKYISSLFSFVPMNEFTQNIIILSIINNVISFVVIFIILFILKKLLGLIIKPLFNSIVNFLSITVFFNRLLGMIFSFFESILISYIVLILLMTPIVNNGYYYIHNTLIAKEVLKIVPEYTRVISNWSFNSMNILEENSLIDDEYIASFIIKSYELGMINDKQIINLINDQELDLEVRNKIKEKVVIENEE